MYESAICFCLFVCTKKLPAKIIFHGYQIIVINRVNDSGVSVPAYYLTHPPGKKMTTILSGDNFKCIFLNENYRILIRISQKLVPSSPIDNKSALVKVMAQHSPSHFILRMWNHCGWEICAPPSAAFGWIGILRVGFNVPWYRNTQYADVIKWKRFPCHWPFVRGIHRSQVDSITKASNAEFWYFLDPRLNKRLRKQSRRRWFETSSRSLWRHCKEKK